MISKSNGRGFLFPLCLCAFVFQIFVLASCVKDDLYDTPHPDHGAVTVNAYFAEKSENATVPAEYTLAIGGTTCTATPGTDFCHPALFAPGNYTLTAYNECDGMTASGTTVTVNTLADGTVESLPGYLFTQSREITVICDDTLRVSLPMAQRVRDLLLRLTVTEGNPERIASLTGTLSGIAGAFDLMGQTVTGEVSSTRFSFVRDSDKVSADLRLLGTKGTVQVLTVTITFTDGQTQTVESDLTEALAAFNDGTEAMTLAGDLRTPVEIGIGSSAITPWEVVDGGNVSAN